MCFEFWWKGSLDVNFVTCLCSVTMVWLHENHNILNLVCHGQHTHQGTQRHTYSQKIGCSSSGSKKLPQKLQSTEKQTLTTSDDWKWGLSAKRYIPGPLNCPITNPNQTVTENCIIKCLQFPICSGFDLFNYWSTYYVRLLPFNDKALLLLHLWLKLHSQDCMENKPTSMVYHPSLLWRKFDPLLLKALLQFVGICCTAL